MPPDNFTTHALLPPTFTELRLASYRTLLPLYNNENDSFSPWGAFLPSGPDSREQLRTMDLYELRHAAADAGQSMDGWDSSRGMVAGAYIAMLHEALSEFVPGDDVWTLLRWRGHGYDLPDAKHVTISELEYDEQELDLTAVLDSIREMRMPEFMWCSTRSFAWGAALYPDYGVMTMSEEHFIRHFASRGFEAFYVTQNAALPDNLGD